TDIISAFATFDDEGNATSFNAEGLSALLADVADDLGTIDFETYNKLITALVSARAKKREANKTAIKAQKEAKDAENAEKGKAYYDLLPIGAEFEIETSNGIVKVKKIETKSKTGSTAACELLNPPAGSKTAKRYPKFCKVVVPAEFGVEKAVEAPEEVVA
ncbi:MAG: hypothetical protein J6Z11_09985, partial [Candidatus Riflebacteria bacterium]|nr:hypothetical protein [Candidatus Riflebacteria bacterium]